MAFWRPATSPAYGVSDHAEVSPEKEPGTVTYVARDRSGEIYL